MDAEKMMEQKPYVDDGKDWFFKNGKLERYAVPISEEGANFTDDLAAAGYQQICTFGMEGGFRLEISQQKGTENYMASIDYGEWSQIIWIDSFPDYMEFMRQFGHLGTLAETSATRCWIEETREMVLDRNWGLLREEVVEAERRREAIRVRSLAKAERRPKT